jgi:hypothetical protein
MSQNDDRCEEGYEYELPIHDSQFGADASTVRRRNRRPESPKPLLQRNTVEGDMDAETARSYDELYRRSDGSDNNSVRIPPRTIMSDPQQRYPRHYNSDQRRQRRQHAYERTRQGLRAPSPEPLTTEKPEACDAAATPSFPDRVAASALNATIDLLKLAGGMTLNTTGKLVAPPLHVTRTVLLPALFYGLFDFIKGNTPIRLQDWARIVVTAFQHFVDVLRKTKQGIVFRHQLVQVGVDVLSCLRSVQARQALIDWMALTVKLAEAAHTPEVQTALEQAAVWAGRLMEWGGSGPAQRLVHDSSQLTWNLAELLANPATTTALAEVTAYLCHALEMEEIVDGTGLPTNGMKQHQKRRRDRDRFQQQTYTGATRLQDPYATVEEVILSSLGLAASDASLGRSNVPSSIQASQRQSSWDDFDLVSSGEAQRRSGRSPDSGDNGRRSRSLPPVVESTDAQGEVLHTQQRQRLSLSPVPNATNAPTERVTHDSASIQDRVNVAFLRQKIHQRAEVLHMDRYGTPKAASLGKREEPGDKDQNSPVNPHTNDSQEDDLEDYVVTTASEEKNELAGRKKIQVEVSDVDSLTDAGNENEDSDEDDLGKGEDEWIHPSERLPLPNESPEQHFYRILDEVLTHKRQSSIENALIDYERNTQAILSRHGTVRKRPLPRTQNDGERDQNQRLTSDLLQDSVKEQLATIRGQVGARLKKGDRDRFQRMEDVVREHGRLVYVALLVLFVVVLVWFFFGCFGIYVTLRPLIIRAWRMILALFRADRGTVVATLLRQLIPAQYLSDAVLNTESTLVGPVVQTVSPTVGSVSSTTECAASTTQEIVIRVVREVIHKNEKGDVISRVNDPVRLSQPALRRLGAWLAGIVE